MKIIGLAGGSGSGKSTVCKLFFENGFAYINTDEVYHALTATPTPCLDDLVHEFGREILNTDSYSLNRQKLAEKVFKDGATEKLQKLNEIAHYHILKHTQELIDELSEDEYFGVLIDAPLLFESGFNEKCDLIISVIASEDIRIKRITERDGISEEKAKMRIRAQLSDEFLKKNSNYLIVNDGDVSELYKKVDEISEKIKNL